MAYYRRSSRPSVCGPVRRFGGTVRLAALPGVLRAAREGTSDRNDLGPSARAAFSVPGRVTMGVHLAMGVFVAAFDLTALPDSWGAHWEGLSEDNNAGLQVVGELGGAIAVSAIAW